MTDAEVATVVAEVLQARDVVRTLRRARTMDLQLVNG